MAERLIDAEAYKSYIRKTYCQYCDGCFDEWRHDDCWQWYAIRTLEEMPTIEAKSIVHAHWDEVSGGRTICTNCGNHPLYDYFGRLKLSDICPHCGAQMDGKEK